MTDWMHRTAPPLGKVYPAWRNDPMTGERPKNFAPWIVIGFLSAGAFLSLMGWVLK